MKFDRRELLRTLGATAGAAALAGCGATDGNQTDETSPETGQSGEDTTDSDDENESDGGSAAVGANVAVAAQWNVYRARLADAVALGIAGDFSGGASIAEDVFASFEGASGEWGAHEQLEHTSESSYEGFEGALEALKESLESESLATAKLDARDGSQALRAAQVELVGETATQALDMQLMGANAGNVRMLAGAGHFQAAAAVAGEVLDDFEDAAVHDALESADEEAYSLFENGLKQATTAAESEDAATVESKIDAAVDGAVQGSYALAEAETTAGAGHLATMQARGFDAATLAGLGGPGTNFAHAGTLTTYRARAVDAARLAAAGETEVAATIAGDIYAHFEGARAHEGLEHADHEAYEAFEGGLESLKEAIENGDSAGIESALATVDESLVTGIGKLATGTEAAVLEAAFFRARVEDAILQYESGEASAAADSTSALYERFEKDELGFHEAFEHADHEAYESFEGHLESLGEAFSNGDDAAVETEGEATLSVLFEFETMVGSTTLVSVAEASYMTALGFDAATLATVGATDRAKATLQSAYEHFESGAGGFHEALEHADHDLYESFEHELEGGIEAVGSGGDVYAKTKAFSQQALDAMYTLVESAGSGDFTAAAAGIASGVYEDFENAEVHELLEEADHAAYETFEHELEALVEALENGEAVSSHLSAFAAATLRAQFAVVGAVDKAPVGTGNGGSEEGGETDPELTGGPNVQDGVPEDADHVVDMKAVSFEPAELTVKKGDTVAWKHVAGEAHSVTAKGDAIPEGASFWASGGFESQDAAETGWEEGKGAVQSGQSYVHTFETTGTHEYYCIPHAAAGMAGTVVVEE
ncbi:DUF5059 domain-containing protein [Haloarchaeobius sp. DYHT-AS-18]|uniref:DUF5059 domain-containing protein n=1 Tax=Haloarchaeobius sp. DYHT-AS-18 TaxID=3446117 RepID=UPI003EBB0CF2